MLFDLPHRDLTRANLCTPPTDAIGVLFPLKTKLDRRIVRPSSFKQLPGGPYGVDAYRGGGDSRGSVRDWCSSTRAPRRKSGRRWKQAMLQRVRQTKQHTPDFWPTCAGFVTTAGLTASKNASKG
jgi:hypothetical protein